MGDNWGTPQSVTQTLWAEMGRLPAAEGLLPEALAPALGPHFPAQFLAPGPSRPCPVPAAWASSRSPPTPSRPGHHQSLSPVPLTACPVPALRIFTAPPPAPLKSAGSESFSFGVPQRPSRPAPTLSDPGPGSRRRRMGCARSRPSCCRPPRKVGASTEVCAAGRSPHPPCQACHPLGCPQSPPAALPCPGWVEDPH